MKRDTAAFDSSVPESSAKTQSASKREFKVVNVRSEDGSPAEGSLGRFASEKPVSQSDSSRTQPRRWSITRIALTGLALLSVIELGLLVRMYRPTPAPVPTATTVALESTPAGATIAINGETRGETPATITLKPGEYDLSLTHGTLTRHVPLVVREGTNGAHFFLDEATQAPAPEKAAAAHATVPPTPAPAPAPNSVGGWVSISVPFDAQIFENDALIGTSQSDRIMLPVGRHTLKLVNNSLGYNWNSTVQVSAGSVARIKADVPLASLNVNAVPWADVTIDGRPVGTTPLGNVSLPIGPHDIVFTHPQLGERRQAVQVTANGANRISVNLNQR